MDDQNHPLVTTTHLHHQNGTELLQEAKTKEDPVENPALDLVVVQDLGVGSEVDQQAHLQVPSPVEVVPDFLSDLDNPAQVQDPLSLDDHPLEMHLRAP